jgi:hypothetical protein
VVAADQYRCPRMPAPDSLTGFVEPRCTIIVTVPRTSRVPSGGLGGRANGYTKGRNPYSATRCGRHAGS